MHEHLTLGYNNELLDGAVAIGMDVERVGEYEGGDVYLLQPDLQMIDWAGRQVEAVSTQHLVYTTRVNEIANPYTLEKLSQGLQQESFGLIQGAWVLSHDPDTDAYFITYRVFDGHSRLTYANTRNDDGSLYVPYVPHQDITPWPSVVGMKAKIIQAAENKMEVLEYDAFIREVVHVNLTSAEISRLRATAYLLEAGDQWLGSNLRKRYSVISALFVLGTAEHKGQRICENTKTLELWLEETKDQEYVEGETLADHERIDQIFRNVFAVLDAADVRPLDAYSGFADLLAAKSPALAHEASVAEIAHLLHVYTLEGRGALSPVLQGKLALKSTSSQAQYNLRVMMAELMIEEMHKFPADKARDALITYLKALEDASLLWDEVVAVVTSDDPDAMLTELRDDKARQMVAKKRKERAQALSDWYKDFLIYYLTTYKSDVAHILEGAPEGDSEAFAGYIESALSDVERMILPLSKSESESKDNIPDVAKTVYDYLNQISTLAQEIKRWDRLSRELTATDLKNVYVTVSEQSRKLLEKELASLPRYWDMSRRTGEVADALRRYYEKVVNAEEYHSSRQLLGSHAEEIFERVTKRSHLWLTGKEGHFDRDRMVRMLEQSIVRDRYRTRSGRRVVMHDSRTVQWWLQDIQPLQLRFLDAVLLGSSTIEDGMKEQESFASRVKQRVESLGKPSSSDVQEDAMNEHELESRMQRLKRLFPEGMPEELQEVLGDLRLKDIQSQPEVFERLMQVALLLRPLREEYERELRDKITENELRVFYDAGQ